MSPVLLEDRPLPGVARLRLNRPEVLNALNLELRHALAAAFTRLDGEAELRVIVLAGGAQAFCAGADLGEYVDATPQDLMARRHDRLWGAIAQCRTPVIAAVCGHALGGGFELAAHADIVVAAAGARFGQPEVKVGIVPGGGATQRLSRIAGKHRALNILLRGQPFSAQEALAMGLVSEVVADTQVEERALQIAQELCELPPVALRLIKEAVLTGLDTGLQAGLAFERGAFQTVFATADKTEGMRARLDKRAPRFVGR